MVQIGETVGNYRILEDLASGSFGSVYRGTHAVLTTRIVAIKLMHSAHLSSQQDHEKFYYEARLLEMLEHPNILRIFDVGIHEGTPYIVTAYAPGGSLRQCLKRQAGRPLVFTEALKILWQIAQALDHAHNQNVIHRDLKPENILFDAQGNVLLADFGISSLLGTRSVHQTTPSGTPAYMAPEQFKGELSRESDQYALGCIAYELLTGQRPFVAPDFIALGFLHTTEQAIPPRHLNNDLPEYAEQAILRALAKGRKQRFSSVIAFVTALEKPPKTSDQWLSEGCEYLADKQYEKALTAFEQALLLDPNSDGVYNLKGLTLIELGKYEEYDKALQNHEQGISPAHVSMLANGRYEEALRILEQGLLLNPNRAATYGNKGLALLYLHRYEEALQVIEQAIGLDPSNFNFYHNKRLALLSLKRYEEVQKIYEQIVLLKPSSASSYQIKGCALERLDRREEALQAYERAILLDPNIDMPVSLWSDLFRLLKRLQAWEQATLLDPNNKRAYYEKGGVLEELNRHEEALRAYEQAILLDPNNSRAYGEKGHILTQLNRYEEALQAFEQEVAVNPNDAFAYEYKGRLLNKLNRYEEALRAFEKAIALWPFMPVFYRHKGAALKQLNRFEEALQAYEQAIALDPNDVDSNEALGILQALANSESPNISATPSKPVMTAEVGETPPLLNIDRAMEKEPSPQMPQYTQTSMKISTAEQTSPGVNPITNITSPSVREVVQTLFEVPLFTRLANQFAEDFARTPRGRFFRRTGMLLNFISAILLGVLIQPPSAVYIFTGMIWSLMLFWFCIRAVNTVFSAILGLLVAFYWGIVGLVIGTSLSMHLAWFNMWILPWGLGLLFLIISIYLHLHYVVNKVN